MSESVHLSYRPSRRTDSSFISSSVYLQQPLIRLFIATLDPSRHLAGPSFFLDGFVFVAATVVVAQTQHRDKDFLGGFVFVAAAAVAQTQHTDINFLSGFVFVAFGEPSVGVNF